MNHTVISDTDALVELPPTAGNESRAINVTLTYDTTPNAPLTATFELSSTSTRADIQPNDPLDGGGGTGGGDGGDGGDGGGGIDGGDGGDGRLIFTQSNNGNNDLRSLGQGGDVVFSYGIEESVKALGPSIKSFDNDAAIEIPVVVNAPNQDGSELVLVDSSGDISTRIGGVKSGRVTVGSFDGSPESIFFVEQDTNDIARFTPETEQGRTEVTNNNAQAIAGIADVDDDVAAEVVFGGNSPSGSSGTVNYIDDDGSLEGTGVQFGSNNGAGIGRPADFDGDFQARIPIVNGNQNIALVDDTGSTTVLTSGEPAKKAPLGTTDFDGDSAPEIMFLATDNELKYIDDVTGDNNVRVPVDSDGDALTSFNTASGLSGGQRATVQTQTASRTDADAQAQAVFVEKNSNELVARNESGLIDTPDIGGSIKATGSPIDLTGGPSEEYPVVLSDSGTLKLNGTGEALATEIKQPVAVRSSVSGSGQFAFDSPSIFFAGSSDGDIRRVTPEDGELSAVDIIDSSVNAQIVAGPADIDGDDAAEFVFGGNSPSGNSNKINYIDDDGSLEGTGAGYGSSNAAGVGQPADFNNDDIARVPIVNGNQKIALVDAAGKETVLTDEKVKNSAPAVVNYDDDSKLEIVYIGNSNSEVKYIDNVTFTNRIETVSSGPSARPGAGVR